VNSLIQAVRPTGRIGVVGDFGTFFFKGRSMGTGQANVKQYNRALRNLIHRDKLSPGGIVSHELNLDEAADGYRNVDERLDGWTKVVLHP
jgi:threonine dehydrogenase-like Zn-dependent dehydrogenase